MKDTHTHTEGERGRERKREREREREREKMKDREREQSFLSIFSLFREGKKKEAEEKKQYTNTSTYILYLKT